MRQPSVVWKKDLCIGVGWILAFSFCYLFDVHQVLSLCSHWFLHLLREGIVLDLYGCGVQGKICLVQVDSF